MERAMNDENTTSLRQWKKTKLGSVKREIESHLRKCLESRSSDFRCTVRNNTYRKGEDKIATFEIHILPLEELSRHNEMYPVIKRYFDSQFDDAVESRVIEWSEEEREEPTPRGYTIQLPYLD